MALSLTTGRRNIKDGKRFEYLFPKPEYSDPVLSENGDVDYTVKMMAEISTKYRSDTARLAPLLKGDSVKQTITNVWQFMYDHLQYKEDRENIEELRRPARSWADRNDGVDCDCMSIFASSILKNLGIKHQFRVTKYNAGDEWQHVYVIVPNGKSYYTIDGVIGAANTEKQFHKNKDYNAMTGIPIQLLNGLNGDGNDIKTFLHKFKARLLESPNEIQSIIHPNDALLFVNHLLKNFDDPHSRITALSEVVKLEKKNPIFVELFQTIEKYYAGTATIEDVYNSCYYSQPRQQRQHRNRDVALDGLDGGCGKNGVAKFAMVTVRLAALAVVRLNIFHIADKLAPGFMPNHKDSSLTSAQGSYTPYDGATWGSGKATWNPKAYFDAIGLSATERTKRFYKLYSKTYNCSKLDGDWKHSILWRWRKSFGGDWYPFKRAVVRGAEKHALKEAKKIPGYQFWAHLNPWNLVPMDGYTDPNSNSKINGLGSTDKYEGYDIIENLDFSSIQGIRGLGDGGASAAIIANAAAALAILLPLVLGNGQVSQECLDLLAKYSKKDDGSGEDPPEPGEEGEEEPEDYSKYVKCLATIKKNADKSIDEGGTSPNKNSGGSSSNFTDWIKENPLPTAAIAFGVAVLTFLGVKTLKS